MGKFSQVIKESSAPMQSNLRTGSDFVKLTNKHQTVIRVIDTEPKVSWSHWVPQGHHAFPACNAGKGMSFICPGLDVCPICLFNKAQKAKDPKTTDLLKARRVYTFNVLDRTTTLVCPNCQVEHYEEANSFPATCGNCNASLSDVTPEPRNKIKIMQKGRRIADQFTAFEEEPDLGDVTGYDIKMDTRGKGTESMTTCIPKSPVALDYDTILGEGWEENKYKIDEVAAALTPEKITRVLSGEDYYIVAKE